MVGGRVGGDDGDLFAGGAEFLADDEGPVDAFEQEGQFGGARAGRGEDGDLVVGAADVHGAAQGAGVGDDRLGVLPRHSGAGEGGGDGGDGGHHFDFETVLGCAQGAHDAEESGVSVGEDHGAAAMPGDPAGREVHGAETDALRAARDFGQREVMGGAGDEGGGRERGRGRSGQWRAVPADHCDPVGHLSSVSWRCRRWGWWPEGAGRVRLPGADPYGAGAPESQFQSL